jgi:hypothetical protein
MSLLRLVDPEGRASAIDPLTITAVVPFSEGSLVYGPRGLCLRVGVASKEVMDAIDNHLAADRMGALPDAQPKGGAA